MLTSTAFRTAALVMVIAVVFGCSTGTSLPVAPNVLRDGSGSAQLRQLPQAMQTTDMHILYVTDRAPIKAAATKSGLEYGFTRSGYVAYGEATVSMDKGVKWDEVVRYSGSPSDSERYDLTVTDVRERGRFVPTLDRLVPKDGRLVLGDPASEDREIHAAQAVLEQALAGVPEKDVYIFIHGFNNSFDDAVLRMACIWHYLGRRGVPVVYTWPAGRGGLTGYFYDRESGEFTIYHLKRVLKIIATTPGVERIHIIAHSRGTDVATTALREINGELRGAGKDPQAELKLKTLVLAAPDLDRDVFAQRFGAENMVSIAGQIVLYTSQEDAAIRFAKKLFGSSARMGDLEMAKAPLAMREKISGIPTLQFVSADVSGFSSSHAYVFANPAAMSDLVLVLRDQKMPGAANGRPMKQEVGWWYLDNTYWNNPANWVKPFHRD